MSAADVPSFWQDDWRTPRFLGLDEPRDAHDARCAVWTSSDPDSACSRLDDCRDDTGHATRPHLVPEPGSTAARLDALSVVPVELDCDRDETAGGDAA